jgi:hypothetical protein
MLGGGHGAILSVRAPAGSTRLGSVSRYVDRKLARAAAVDHVSTPTNRRTATKNLRTIARSFAAGAMVFLAVR